VLIDDRLPCQNSKPVFGTCKNENETWVPLIEKAYAKLHTCYEALISGFIDDALSELTGFVAEKVILHD
jgi:Calpain family cysteine protease